jgi:hypothetical protein
LGIRPEMENIMPKSNRTRCDSGANLSDCKKRARQLGCDITPVIGTGEIRFTHPKIQRCMTVDGRRKDAPRALTTWLKHVDRIVSGNAP